MKIRKMADEIRFPTMSTAELRETFLIEGLFAPGELTLHYVDLDRAVVGSAVPTDTELRLQAEDPLAAAYFTERRELGILNIGGAGYVRVGGERFDLETLDALYVGRGQERVIFGSVDASRPSEFYLLSYPAHAGYPTRLIKATEQVPTKIGAVETSNQREITRMIHLDGVRSAQLVMGFTRLAPGSVWNTMPPHTHMRRTEVYFFFDLPETDRVIHLMGPPQETRNLIVANKQVVLSPGWSIHAGAGTRNYTFCWGMGGENQVYSDMDAVAICDLR